MTTTGRLDLVAFDAQDTEKLAAFYVDLAGWEIIRNDGGWINVRTGDGQEVGFQPARTMSPRSGPASNTPSNFPSTCSSTAIRRPPNGPSAWARPGWPTVPPG